jgi:hypothetical protein
MFYPFNLSASIENPQWVIDFFSNFYISPDINFWEEIISIHPQNKIRLDELLTIIQNKPFPIGAFAGAGISKSYAMPTWGEFLTDAAKQMDAEGYIDQMLAECRYPEAAQVLEDHDADSFEDIIRKKFSHQQIVPQLLGVGSLLPFLPFDYLITTNFDNILEAIYHLAGMTINPVIYGAHPSFARAAQMEKMLPLLKIHGDYLNGRILTQRQYEKSYGKDSPLYSHLVDIFSTISFLFIGFSFTDVEIKEALKEAKAKSNIPHFVIIKANSREYALENDLSLTDLGVYPIWHTGDHTQASKILGHFVNYLRKDFILGGLGICLSHKGVLNNTLEDCEALLAERPGCHPYQLAYVNSLLSSVNSTSAEGFDEISEHIARIDKAIGRQTVSAEAYELRALLNLQRFSFDESYNDLTKAIKHGTTEPGSVYALRGVINLHYKLNSKEAKEDFITALTFSKHMEPPLRQTVEFYLVTIAIYNCENNALANLQKFFLQKDLSSEMIEIKKQLRSVIFGFRVLEKMHLLNLLIKAHRRTLKKSSNLGIKLAVKAGRAGLFR